MKQVNIGLLGCGTVGTGVAKMLLENADLISARMGTRLNLRQVADIDITTDRGIVIPEDVWTTNAEAVIQNPEIDLIVETIGGEGIAKELILKAIANGKHIVTANKALLASQGNNIFRAALEKKVDIGFSNHMPITNILMFDYRLRLCPEYCTSRSNAHLHPRLQKSSNIWQ